MVDVINPSIEWSLSDLPKIYQEAQMQRARQNSPLLAPYGGDMGLAALAMQQQRDTRDFGFREQEAKRAQGNTDRASTLQREQFETPPGWQRVGGVMAPIPGGPADPKYIHEATEAKDKGRNMSAGDITKLSEEGGKFSAVKGFIDTFDDKFAGQTLLGGARNSVARNLPEWATDPDARKGAEWWQNYDRYKNVVRNDLFGSALTATEQAAFTAADITPNMNPAAVKANLETQRKVLEGAMKRKAGGLVAEGFRPDTVARGFGVELKDLGVEPKKAAKPAGGDAPPVPGAKQGRKPDGSMGWFFQSNGKTYLVE